MSDAPASPTTPTKEDEKTKTTNGSNSKKFEGDGTPFKAKLIGMEDLSVDRDEKICLDSMFKLKAVVRARGEHKQRIQLNLTMSAVKITDETTKSQIASHEIERISFVVIDPRDNRAFGYIYNTSDDRHQFWAFKTERAAAGTVLALKELFELAFEQFTKLKEPEVKIDQKPAPPPPATNPEPIPPKPDLLEEPVPQPKPEPDGWLFDPEPPTVTSSPVTIVTTNQQSNSNNSLSHPPISLTEPDFLFDDRKEVSPPVPLDPLFDLFQSSTQTPPQPVVSQIGNVPIQPVQPTFPNLNTVVQPQTQQTTVFPNSVPILTPQPSLLTPSPTSPSAPSILLNPLSDSDFFGGLTLGPSTTKPTKDLFFPSTGPSKSIQQMQMEKQS